MSISLPYLADQFLLRRDVTFLNHGSFGACPRPIFERYQAWQRELEAQPVEFLGRRVLGLLDEARRDVAELLHTEAQNLVFVDNATTGVNIVLRSLDWRPGDEVLITDQEYGACIRALRFVSGQKDLRIVTQPVPVDTTDAQATVDALWQAVTPRTKLILLSHITSPTALILPVEAICARARRQGIMTLVDGAHAPGQIDLNMQAIDADFYTGNFHKWMCTPKGSAFLYARPEHHDTLQPLVVSHGWKPDYSERSRYHDLFDRTGTNDPSAYLSVPTAIAFQREHDWPAVRAACHALLVEARNQIAHLTGAQPRTPDERHAQMGIAPLGVPATEGGRIKEHLWDHHRIEMPLTSYADQLFARVSIQCYNGAADVEKLVAALAEVL